MNTQQQTVIANNQQPDDEIAELRQDIRDELEHTIAFRKRTSEKYSSDTRNPRAVQQLTQLLDSVGNIPDPLLIAFGKALDAEPDDKAIDSYMRAIGFKWAPSSAAELVQSFINDPHRFVAKWNAVRG
jgi:hypothetical protein